MSERAPVILGLAAGLHDSACALVRGGTILAAAQEERFTRRRHDAAMPVHARAACLATAGITVPDREVVAGRDLPWVDALAAAAVRPSPHARAMVLVLDAPEAGMAVFRGEDSALAPRGRTPAGTGLGALYSAVTAYLGFKPGSAEFKVMGLAPYGRPRFAGALVEAAGLAADEALPQARAIDPSAVFGAPARAGEGEPLTAFHQDIAASVQAVTERVLVRLVRRLAAEEGMDALCMAGETALNCVANAAILRAGAVRHLWVQPAAGPAGAALGAALVPDMERPGGDRMAGALLGPAYTTDEASARLSALGARFTQPDEAALLATVAEALDAGQAVGWMRGRMEFGPRALGARSILADPRRAGMRDTLNRKIKLREGFRPFAPAVRAEDAGGWFQIDGPSPYMLRTVQTRDPAALPAVTHVDGSARVQTVDAAVNPRFHALLTAFHARTGCPVLVNTSFNVRGEPIVESPEDAFRCFMGTDLDLLVVEGCLLRKSDQDPALLRPEHGRAFAPD